MPHEAPESTRIDERGRGGTIRLVFSVALGGAVGATLIRYPSVLSIENTHGWSWGIVIGALIDHLPGYHFARIQRGQFHCGRCRMVYHHRVDEDLLKGFDLIFPQNHDGTRYIHEQHQGKVIARIGGLVMHPQIDPERYASDFRAVGAIIATNDGLADIALASNPDVTVIPNGVPLDIFTPGPDFPNWPDRPFTIGFAGNVHGSGADYKGWKFFCQATVDLAADGVRQLYCIHGHNQLAHKDMPQEFYRKIDALVLPSKGEGCSNVVTEALACGVPVIMTRVGFHGERLTGGENVLYIDRDLDGDSPQTTRGIVEAVRRLIAEPELYSRLARNSRAFAEEHHDVRKVAAAYDRVFQRILEKRKGQA